jgi:hypothetical protein
VIDTGSDLPTARQQQVSSSSSSNQGNLNIVGKIEQGIQPNLTGNNNRSELNRNDRNDNNEREIAAFYNAIFKTKEGT